ncbi:uncharacterized protein [Arachis hypogaea]|uniref:Uncharacterized protein n=1 Tax=Arachis hypogaea TaxID=3818 RepID=A0A445E0T9_ARAHY|nr:uncharacterized protein LOC112773428 [Arachis hypogaea]RYR68999.1 hypothetical protein Ahy_A03g015510 isoform A [Arachis hypogaea]
MHGFYGADSFVELGECWVEMIKYVANEPSIGLFFIQQHTQTAVPNIIKLQNNVIVKSRETSLHTQDLEDSIVMVRSMKECGFSIVDEMIGDIKKSLITMGTKQPKKGLIRPATNIDRTSSAGNSAIYALESSEKRGITSSQGMKTEEFNLSNLIKDEPQFQSQPQHNDVRDLEKLLVSEKYDDFKANIEAKLEEWLKGTNSHYDNCQTVDDKKL